MNKQIQEITNTCFTTNSAPSFSLVMLQSSIVATSSNIVSL